MHIYICMYCKRNIFVEALSELLGHGNCRNGNDEVRGVCVCVCVCADSHSLLSVTKGNAMAKRTSPTAVDVAGHHGEEDNETAPHRSARHCRHLF